MCLLYAVTSNNQYEIRKLLLNKNTDVNIRCHNGSTALFKSIAMNRISSDYTKYLNHYEIMELLLKNGADPNISNDQGATPLTLSSIFSYYEIIHLLLKHGANINHRDRDNWTALMYASITELYQNVKILLNNYADPFLKNNTDNTAYCISCNDERSLKSKRIIKMLLIAMYKKIY